MEPVHGFAAQTVAASVIQLATAWGLPVSTTQVVSGSVMGAGATRRFSAVRWGVARRIVWAWIFTIPASAVLAAVAALLVEAGPVPLAFAVLVVGTVALYLLVRQRRRKQPGDDFATASADVLIARENTVQEHDSEKVSVVSSGTTERKTARRLG